MESPLNLFDTFTLRPDRFKLLDKGINLITNTYLNISRVLEIGCAFGDGSAHMVKEYYCKAEGIDMSEETIAIAKEKHKDLINGGRLRLTTANAENLPYKDEKFDILFSEAAFSPILNKEDAASEYYRVLKKGGFLLINDFATKIPVTSENREEVYYIPCFQGVSTIEDYCNIFKKYNFHIVSAKEEYGELVGVSMWLSKVYKIDILEIGTYLSQFYNYNRIGSNCTGNGEFFKDVKLTYCQMILRK